MRAKAIRGGQEIRLACGCDARRTTAYDHTTKPVVEITKPCATHSGGIFKGYKCVLVVLDRDEEVTAREA